MATPKITRAALAAALAGFSGLDYQVAFNWLSAENSDYPTNPLGILCGNSAGSGLEIGCTGRFAMYRSATDGVKAAAWLVAHGPYQGIRNAIAGGSPVKQRAAIVASPWAGGNYSNGAGFPTTGISGTPSAVTGTNKADRGDQPSASSGRTVADLFSGVSPTHLLTAADIEMILGELTVTGPTDPIIASQRAYYTKYIGQPINKVPVSSSSAFGGHMLSGTEWIPTDLGAAIASFGSFAWVPGFAVNAGILALVLVLGYKGADRLTGSE